MFEEKLIPPRPVLNITRFYCSRCMKTIFVNKKKCSVSSSNDKLSYHEVKSYCLEYTSSECEHCGINNYKLLQFHHKDPSSKLFKISELCNRGYIDDTLNTELDKCSVLCANCHILLHNPD